ncbi:MAG TPA: OsmC family protein [Rhizomicrobium sp.]|nr:OsmC family protein [Rhizomicrobium sp.]
MAHAKAEIGTVHYAVHIETGGHELISDEPVSRGGADAGPAPYDLLLSSLGACTAITLRMYAERKQWDLRAAGVSLRYFREGDSERIERKLRLDGPLTDEQRKRMADIAERTPVTLTLKRGLPITTELEPNG